jgi:hypothetical protein
MITKPATNLNEFEFCKSTCPKYEAEAPKIINTIENQHKI